MAEAILKTEQLSFPYPAENEPKLVLDGVDLEVEAGSFVAVLGHNGSGKSTLAKHMNAILLPSGGKVYVSGMDTMDEDLLLDIRRVTKATVLFVTHSIAEAIYLSDRVLVFSKRPATIAKELNVDIPYPRSAQSRFLPEFHELEREAGVALGVMKP